jgi:hypothetical protein
LYGPQSREDCFSPAKRIGRGLLGKTLFGLQWVEMKPCSCNSNNERCCYCEGRGYVDDETPVPGSSTSDLLKWQPESHDETEFPPRPFVRQPTNWKEIIVGVLAFLFPFIMIALLKLLKWLFNSE